MALRAAADIPAPRAVIQQTLSSCSVHCRSKASVLVVSQAGLGSSNARAGAPLSARILTCSEDEYYADPCDNPSLSQSIANVIVSQSPRHAWTAHPRLGGVRSKPTKAMDEGSAISALLLGKGSEIEICNFDAFRSDAAKAQRDAAIAAGRIPVIASKYAALARSADGLRASLLELNIDLSDGIPEFAIEWTEKGERGDVVCRGKMDLFVSKRGQIFDVKKTQSAHPADCAKSMTNYGYDIQDAAYRSAAAKLLPDLAGRIDMVFLFMEIEPPYAVTPIRASGMMRQLGEMKWQRAVSIWERCLLNNRWPMYVDRVTEVDPPAWAVTQEMGTDYAI